MSIERGLRVREVVAEGPRAVIVRLDLGGQSFEYRAGQAARLGRPSEPTRVPYSIACAPGRARATGTLEFLLRTDAHGRVGDHLDPLEPGEMLMASGPFGRFTLPVPLIAPALLFVAGGVGIAPLRAMIEDVLARTASPPVMLVHSARSAEDFAYGAEFDAEVKAGRLRLARTVTRAPGPATLPRGRITRDLLEGVGVRAGTLCFVCGPDALVGHASRLLAELGIPEEQIRYET
ncbi:MAG: FAD-binding oxidoreductase [Acidobacteriota bacterium]